MDKINVIKTQAMWKDCPNTKLWIDTLKNPQEHGLSGIPDSNYLKAIESLEYILLGETIDKDKFLFKKEINKEENVLVIAESGENIHYQPYLFYVKCKDYYDLESLRKYTKIGLPYISTWALANLKEKWENAEYPVYVHVSGDEKANVFFLNDIYTERPACNGCRIVSNNVFRLMVLQHKLLKLYEPIVSYNNGRFKNMGANDDEGWDLFQEHFPTHRDIMIDYVEMVKNNNTGYIPLPPFIVFPIFSPTTLGWRMGLGEDYENYWMKAIRALSSDDLTKYCKDFNYPLWWIDGNPYNEFCQPRYYNMPWKNL